MTKKLTRNQKTRAAFARAFHSAGMSPRGVNRIMRANWRNILMPWRMIPAPMAWALIGLVALAMVLDMGAEEAPVVASPDTVTLTLGDYIPGESPCAEDAVYDTVGETCIHVDRIAPPFPTGTVAPATVESTATASPTPTVTASPTPTGTPIP